MDPIYMLLFGGTAMISMLISRQLKSKFAKYAKEHLSNGMSGKEIAEQMLADHGIMDVKVISVKGQLTDHYNPTNKTVNLSEIVYGKRNTSAAAVAAHEVGHAVQHAKSYQWLTMRSKMVPMVGIASKSFNILLMAGMVLMSFAPVIGQSALLLGLVMFAISTLFAFVTLPVEYDASNRALKWFKDRNMLRPNELEGAEDALKWAARTYLVAALGSLAQLVYFAMRFLGRRN